jgi:hypothetical protein
VKRPVTWIVAVVALSLSTIISGAFAFAAIPDANGVVHGCFRRSGGHCG